MTTITALIPAHNEEASIAASIESLLAQTRPVDRIVIVCDNCTDRTQEIAEACGAETMVTVGNTAKKAGALNQALDLHLTGSDYILTQDADTVIPTDWVANAIEAVERDTATGAVSGKYQARDGKGLISILQQIEYHQVHRRISRKGGHITVLSGTATLVQSQILADLLAERGFIYDETSLVEDFEITMALRHRGWRPRSYKTLGTVTDVMESWSDLTSQRLRWQRGTIETLWQYGLNRLTWKMWFGQFVSYAMTFVFLMMFFAWGISIGVGEMPNLIWLLIIPLFVLAQIVETRGMGFKRVALAAVLVPLWLYDAYRLYIYWLALAKTVQRSDRNWA